MCPMYRQTAFRLLTSLYADGVALAMCTLHLVDSWRRWTLFPVWAVNLLITWHAQMHCADFCPSNVQRQLLTHYGTTCLSLDGDTFY